jgi:hypothetical protein
MLWYRYLLLNEKGEKIQGQDGIVRTNCIDCLDHTNVTQVHGSNFQVQLYVITPALVTRALVYRRSCSFLCVGSEMMTRGGGCVAVDRRHLKTF